MAETTDPKDLAIQIGQAIATVLGVAAPIPGATLGFLTAQIDERRREGRNRRFRLLLEAATRRLDALEEVDYDDGKVSLIDEIIAQAMLDEDEEKIEYYAAFVEFVVTSDVEPFVIRLIGSAFKQLTVHDFNAFAHFCKTSSVPSHLPKVVEDTFFQRIEAASLFRGGDVMTNANISTLGWEFLRLIERVVDDRGPE